MVDNDVCSVFHYLPFDYLAERHAKQFAHKFEHPDNSVGERDGT